MSTDATGIPRPTHRPGREEIAHIEVGHTTVSPRLARLLVAWFLLLLAALPLVEWLWPRAQAGNAQPRAWSHLADVPATMAERLRALDRDAADATWWTRVVTANRALLTGMSAFETALEDHSAVGRLLRPHTQVLLTGWLGAGNERVYPGRDRWLFYRPDVEYLTGKGFLDPRQMRRRVASAGEIDTAPQPDPLLAIRQFKRDLDARGIALVLVPTPVKPSVHPEQLAIEHRAGDALQNASYGEFVVALEREGLLVFNPATAMTGAHQESNGSYYFATDTHWRPETMQAVAESLARFLEQHVKGPPVQPTGYRAEPREVRQMGDTAAMLDLPPRQTLYPPERVTLRYIMGADGNPWQTSREGDVLVLGDSFTNIYSLQSMGWGEAAGLVEQLSYALQRPIDRIAQNDQGAYATRAMLAQELTAGTDRLAGKRVVVWQFAARELSAGDWKVIALPSPSH